MWQSFEKEKGRYGGSSSRLCRSTGGAPWGGKELRASPPPPFFLRNSAPSYQRDVVPYSSQIDAKLSTSRSAERKVYRLRGVGASPQRRHFLVRWGGGGAFGRTTKQLPGLARSGGVAQGVDSLRRVAFRGGQPRPDLRMYLHVRRKADHFFPRARADCRGQWSRLAPTADSGGGRRSLLADREVLQRCGSYWRL